MEKSFSILIVNPDIGFPFSKHDAKLVNATLTDDAENRWVLGNNGVDGDPWYALEDAVEKLALCDWNIDRRCVIRGSEKKACNDISTRAAIVWRWLGGRSLDQPSPLARSNCQDAATDIYVFPKPLLLDDAAVG
jgi:hypothetical protein